MDRDFYEELGKFMYGSLIVKKKEDDYQPFSIPTSYFAWRYGIQKSFIQAVNTWHVDTFGRQKQSIHEFLHRVRSVDPTQINKNDLLLRNSIIRDCFNLLYVLYHEHKKAKAKVLFHEYLKSSGLGKFIKGMRLKGLNFQI